MNPSALEQVQSPVEELVEHVSGASSRKIRRVVATPATTASFFEGTTALSLARPIDSPQTFHVSEAQGSCADLARRNETTHRLVTVVRLTHMREAERVPPFREP